MKTRLLFTMMITICTLNLSAQIINVPADFSTIQEGIDASSDGDTVLVADETFKEQISFKGKAITLASHYILDGDTSHISNTVIDGNIGLPGDTASAVRFVSGEDTTSVLSGFTIQGGKGTLTTIYEEEDEQASRIGGGIACINATARIVNNRIINNSTTHVLSALGGGIGCYFQDSTAWLIVENNTFLYNECHVTGEDGWPSAGGGALYTNTNVRVVNNTIQYNECHSSHESDGGGIEFESYGSDYSINILCSNNDMQFNLANGVARGIGGAIKSEYGNIYLAENILSNNTTVGNSATIGGGIFLAGTEDYSGYATIENNVFEGNLSAGSGWAAGSAFCLWRTGFDVTFKNNVVNDNSFEGNATKFSAVYIYNTAPLGTLPRSRVEIESNIFTNNVADYGGGLNLSNVLNMSIVNNVFTENEGIYGGAIALTNSTGLEESHTPVVANNTFIVNMASTGGGAISNALRVSLITFNNIFWNDESPDGNDLQSFFDSSMVVNNSLINEDDISGSWEGSNNFYGNPQFMEDDFHISPGSPCYNTGIANFVFRGKTYLSPNSDIDGDERPIEAIVDVGADEQVPLPNVPVALNPSEIGDDFFIAEWETAESADGYFLDLAWDEDFELLVNGYDNLDVGDVTSYQVDDMIPGYPYYYRLRAYNYTGTSDHSNVIIVLMVDLGDNNKIDKTVTVYPNPISSIAIIECEHNIDEIAIYNLAGQLLYYGNFYQNRVELNLSNINEGLLVMQIFTNGSYSTHKIIKQ